MIIKHHLKKKKMLNTTRQYAIDISYYICYIFYNTGMYSQSLESQTDFIMFKHGNHWKWSVTYTLHIYSELHEHSWELSSF